MVFVIVPEVEKGFDTELVPLVLVLDGAELFRDEAMESIASESESDDELVAMLLIASNKFVSSCALDIAVLEFKDNPLIDPLICTSPLLHLP